MVSQSSCIHGISAQTRCIIRLSWGACFAHEFVVENEDGNAGVGDDVDDVAKGNLVLEAAGL